MHCSSTDVSRDSCSWLGEGTAREIRENNEYILQRTRQNYAKVRTIFLKFIRRLTENQGAKMCKTTSY